MTSVNHHGFVAPPLVALTALERSSDPGRRDGRERDSAAMPLYGN